MAIHPTRHETDGGCGENDWRLDETVATDSPAARLLAKNRVRSLLGCGRQWKGRQVFVQLLSARASSGNLFDGVDQHLALTATFVRVLRQCEEVHQEANVIQTARFTKLPDDPHAN